jgi:hypothetical protein
MAASKTFYVLHPIEGPEVGSVASLASRDGSLAGRKLLLLDNGKPNSDKILRRIGAKLKEEYGMLVEFEKKPSHSAPLPAAQLDDHIGRFHYVLTGIGD